MGVLDNYTFLESSDHVDNRKKLFFITFGATSFLRQFSKDSKRHITDVVYWIYWYIQLLVSTSFITVCSVKFVFNWNSNILDLLFFNCHGNCFLVVIATKKKLKNVECKLTEDNDKRLLGLGFFLIWKALQKPGYLSLFTQLRRDKY